MLGIVLAALLAFSPQGGTVYTADGGRMRGTILDAGPGGVSVQLADGSTRKLEAAQVARIDFADGTTWKPAAAPAVAAAAAPVAAAAPAAQAAAPAVVPAAAVTAVAAPAAAASKPAGMAIPIEKLDTVYVARGGRVRCLVIEDGPDGVVVRLVDGTERRYGPGQVSRIDWADGTRSDYAAPAPAAAPPAVPPPTPPVAPPAR